MDQLKQFITKFSYKMKNVLIVTLLLLMVITSNVLAQLTIGVKTGLNINDRYFEIDQVYNVILNPAPQRTKLGYHLGVNLTYELNSSFSLNSGLLYINKGSGIDLEELYEVPVDLWTGEYKVEGYSRSNYNYLEIPLQLSYRIWKELRIYGGPYAAFGIFGRQNDEYTVYLNGNKELEKINNEKLRPAYGKVEVKYNYHEGSPLITDIENENRYNGFDYGLNLGLGYPFDKILISSEYSFGLGNVTADFTNFARDIHRHRILYFSVSYQLFEK